MAKIDITKKYNSYWDISVDGEQKLAIATGIPNRVFGGSDMGRLKSIPGLLRDSAGQISEWVIEGLAEIDSQIIFWGKWLPLVPIDQKQTLNHNELVGMTELFSIFAEKSENPAFSVDSFFRLDKGGLFCFPLNLMEFIHSRQSKELLMSREAYNHPDLKREERLSHTMAILTFQSCTGEMPFTQSGGYEWIHEEMRNKKVPSLENNGMDKNDLVIAIDNALKGESYIPLSHWKKLLVKAPEFPGKMTDTFKASMSKYEDSFVKSFNRRKNQIKITLTALAAIFLIWVGVTLIKNYLEPAYTDGMTQTEVLQAYYDGINNLDTSAIDGTTSKKAGKGISNQVATIYVISKNKQAYSQGSTISPVYWEEKEFMTLPAGYNVYGVSQLEIKSLGSDKYQATYLIWYPPTEDIDNPGAYVDPFEIHRRTEEVYLVRDRRDRAWIIDEFIELEMTPVPSRDILPQK